MHLVTKKSGQKIHTHTVETRAKGKTCIICNQLFKIFPFSKRQLDNTSNLTLVFEHGEVKPSGSIIVHKDKEHKQAIISAFQKASNEEIKKFDGFCADHDSEEYITKINKNLTK